MKALLLATVIVSSILLGKYFLKSGNKSTPLFLSKNDNAVIDAWNQWRIKYEKVGKEASREELNYRFRNFKKNIETIKNWNHPEATYRLGLNKFADLSPEEFRRNYLSTKKPDYKKTSITYLPTSNVPETKDWTSEGKVTAVKNQGQCGSCWAFSSVAATESLMAITQFDTTNLSEQQLVDCSSYLGNEGCDGGYLDKGLEYVVSKGLMTSSDYPYLAQDSDCNFNQEKVYFKPKGYVNVPLNDSVQLKAAVAVNPVSVAIAADQIQFYVDGIWNYWMCFTETDHGVTITGYGTEGNTMYWNVKNSWGDNWGENGYLRMARKDEKGPGMCGICTDPHYPNM